MRARLTLRIRWPAAWLVLVAVFFLNPLPVLRRGTRYWLARVLFRVFTPGYSRVEVSPTSTINLQQDSLLDTLS